MGPISGDGGNMADRHLGWFVPQCSGKYCSDVSVQLVSSSSHACGQPDQLQVNVLLMTFRTFRKKWKVIVKTTY